MSFEETAGGRARHRTSLGLLPVLLALVPALSSCDDDDDDSSADVSNTEISIDEDRDFASGDSIYDWNSPGENARVTLDIDDFHHGDFRLTIFDADGDQIYSRFILSNDWYWYVGDWEVHDVSFTDDGKPGLWTIVLSYDDFTGDVDVLVESTDAAPSPPPDEVGPPTSNSGLLDLAFGDHGRATYGPGAALSREAVVDGRGRIVTAGILVDSDNRKRLAVWRFSSGGELDTSFGSGGVFVYDDAAISAAAGLAVDANSRVIVTGFAADAEARTDLVLLRLTATGQRDASFGASGVAILDQGDDEIGTAVARDQSGRLLVTGGSRDSSGELIMILARYLKTGILDDTFGNGGIVHTNRDGDIGWDVAVDPQGGPIVVGARAEDMIMWKYTTAGKHDTSFGDGGAVISAGGSGEFRSARAIAIADDGRLTVCGVRSFDNGDHSELVVWRFSKDGDPVSQFGEDGFAAIPFSGGVAAGNDVAVDSSGRVLVAGSTRSSNQHDGSATLWRITSNGSLDASLQCSDGSGVVRFDERSDGVSTGASSIALTQSSVIAAGGAVDHETGAVDLLVWKLRP